ncbi:MAG TPA: hypothetical protein VIU61_27555, partial [Kofleriaceae bacterium]
PVTVTPPAPPAPAPVLAPVPPPAPPPRALVPKLDPSCVIMTDDPQPATCAWDNGFPAIAHDGSLIATMHAPSAGPSDLYSLSIRFLDPETSRTVKDVVILTQDEASAFVYPDENSETAYKLQTAVRTKVARRVAAVQKTLDRTKFRTLRALGGWRENQDPAEEPIAHPTDHVYGEIVGSAIRIVDPKTATVLWRGDLSVANSNPLSWEKGDDCGGWSLWGLSTWWDAETQTVLALSTYRTGGCMCSDIDNWSVKRF